MTARRLDFGVDQLLDAAVAREPACLARAVASFAAEICATAAVGGLDAILTGIAPS